MLSFSPRGVLDEILNLIESVSEKFLPTLADNDHTVLENSMVIWFAWYTLMGSWTVNAGVIVMVWLIWLMDGITLFIYIIVVILSYLCIAEGRQK